MVPPQPRNTKEKADLQQWIAQLPLIERLAFGMSQIALWFAHATDWQLESRQLHGTCIAYSINDDHLTLGAPLANDDPANVWCLPPGPTWWAHAVLTILPELSTFTKNYFPRL